MAQHRRDGISELTQQRYWREAEGRAIVTAWQQSGQPLSKFAREHGLKRARIARWTARLRTRSSGTVRFHTVRLVEGRQTGYADAAIEVVLVDGRRVRVREGFAAEDLRRVLLVLEEQASC